ncbi:MAG: type I 3-dehydroquinate dehydratase, partial [Deltaproteobacteria bacterium]|nr:type I 3-dehydroquinate dehydratase [Deltaproteobacteria bacterium]
MICIPITARTTDQAIAEMQSAEKTADIVEIRLDYIGSPDLERILKSRTKPVIITIMPTSEGGHFTGSEQERTALFQQAIELGAEHIDVNFGNPALAELLQQKKKTRIIVSYHNFSETPAD